MADEQSRQESLVREQVLRLEDTLNNNVTKIVMMMEEIREEVGRLFAAQAENMESRRDAVRASPRSDGTEIGKHAGLLAAGIGEDDGVGISTSKVPGEGDLNRQVDGVSVTVWYATNRKAIMYGHSVVGYGSEWDENVHYGKCTVTVDTARPIGGFHESLVSRILMRKGSGVAMKTLEDLEEAIWLNQLKGQLSEATKLGRSLLVFIHGYWNSFENAIHTAGALAADVGGWAATAAFSWPSEGIGTGYFRDAEMCAASEWQCETAVRKLIEESGAESVHFVGHSMGNRLLLRVLERLEITPPANIKVLKNIIFAAPDVEKTIFEALISRGPGKDVRKTLYMSRRDLALKVSQRWANRTDRAGLAPPVLICNGVDTIDVSDVDLSSNGHRAFREAPKVIEDMYYVITNSLGPDARHGLVYQRAGDKAYWKFKE